jgi:glycosyltransferase involved in cell wall biosynthesis
MHIAIITRSLPPQHCGIADHTVLLAQSLRDAGHRVILIAGQGEANDNSLIIDDNWDKNGLSRLLRRLEELEIDHLLLQYIPLGFLTERRSPLFAFKHYMALMKFWKSCSKRWKTSLIVHETYYRVWSHPSSMVKGTIQKYLLKSLVAISHHVFTASQLLVEEMKAWGTPYKITYMPLTSHFPYLPTNKAEVRCEKQIDSRELVLTLFGGGNALRLSISWVHEVDRRLHEMNIPVRWLLLGGIPHKWLNLSAPVISPGRLDCKEMSRWLQMTDIFLAPQSCGLAARRTTFLAALQHGLPIVGTKGYLTDPFLMDLPGLKLTAGIEDFCREVIFLSDKPDMRSVMGESNQHFYNDHFGWEKNTAIFSSVIT